MTFCGLREGRHPCAGASCPPGPPSPRGDAQRAGTAAQHQWARGRPEGTHGVHMDTTPTDISCTHLWDHTCSHKRTRTAPRRQTPVPLTEPGAAAAQMTTWTSLFTGHAHTASYTQSVCKRSPWMLCPHIHVWMSPHAQVCGSLTLAHGLCARPHGHGQSRGPVGLLPGSTARVHHCVCAQPHGPVNI